MGALNKGRPPKADYTLALVVDELYLKQCLDEVDAFIIFF